jgi:hypothetical protein
MLKTGQIIRYDSGLWRVEYVNESRARIIPLAKRHVTLHDKDGAERDFESGMRGANISPNSEVEIVQMTAALADELEMAKLEREIAALKKQAEKPPAVETPRANKNARTPAINPRKGAPPAIITPAPTPAPTLVPAEGLEPAILRSRGAGWYLIGTAEVIPGSLKALAINYVSENPGRTTKEIAEQIPSSTPGAVAACLDRFRKANVMVASLGLATNPIEGAPAAPKAPRVKAVKKPEVVYDDF